ncbi:ribonuclease P protein component [Phenylobacterium sp.]|uniref:ribonuclease P protein component n=1 Tax=Phenylobacterium sp. TaxID=1871053 RepID=UPI00272EF029|nr:ribonuclease P protein component [Phenylobacterium sp.]MDP1617179.1 ribonuclease P protein component [Phenylobacterium sp.]MDP1988599.1 ribonuclease P protein component [Phenylobacterium sp.]
MTDAPIKIERLRKRPDFLAAARAFSCARGAVVVQARDRADDTALVRVGFTATRKVGGAVVRNRAKRRMRAAAHEILPSLARPGFDYVLIARSGAPARAWPRLLDDVKSALISLATESDRQARPSATATPPPA